MKRRGVLVLRYCVYVRVMYVYSRVMYVCVSELCILHLCVCLFWFRLATTAKTMLKHVLKRITVCARAWFILLNGGISTQYYDSVFYIRTLSIDFGLIKLCVCVREGERYILIYALHIRTIGFYFVRNEFLHSEVTLHKVVGWFDLVINGTNVVTYHHHYYY